MKASISLNARINRPRYEEGLSNTIVCHPNKQVDKTVERWSAHASSGFKAHGHNIRISCQTIDLLEARWWPQAWFYDISRYATWLPSHILTIFADGPVTIAGPHPIKYLFRVSCWSAVHGDTVDHVHSDRKLVPVFGHSWLPSFNWNKQGSDALEALQK